MGRLAVAALAALALGIAATAWAQGGEPWPDDWDELTLANEHTATVKSAGDPAGGIYVLQQELDLKVGNTSELGPALAQALEKKGFASKFEPPASVHFESRGTRGTAVVTVASGKARVTTCFYNRREPERANELCQRLLSNGNAP